MVDIEIVREWFAKADEDFHFALVNLKGGNAFYRQICFHLILPLSNSAKSASI